MTRAAQGRRAWRAAGLALALGACGERAGCGARGGVGAPSAATARGVNAALCRREVAQASVGVAPGGGAIASLVASCDERSRALALWVLRGHTLSVLRRSTDPGSSFSLPREVSTGADRFGVLAADAHEGPAVWQSPTTGLESLDREEWWAAVLTRQGVVEQVARGSVRMPEGFVSLGVLAALASDGAPNAREIEVLGTVAREGLEPSLVRVRVGVQTPGASATVLDEGPTPVAPGELKAFEPRSRVALAYAVTPEGNAELRALDFSRDPPRVVGTHRLSHTHLLAVARGVHLAGKALFAVTEFDLGRPGQGPCVQLDETLCVRPGPPVLLVADAAEQSLRAWSAREPSLVDSLAIDPRDGRAVLLSLGVARRAGQAAPAQQVTRIDPAHGEPETFALTLPGDLPPLDRPSLLECGGRLWLAAELALFDDSSAPSGPLADAGAIEAPGPARERAVVALPFECARAVAP